MTSLIGTHQVKSFSSPVNTAAAVDANLVRGNDNVLRKAYVAHDADATIHVQSSTLAARPAAGIVGRKWMTVDGTSVRTWYDTGATWIESGNVIGPASSTDNAVALFDGLTGKFLKNSVVIIDASGNVSGVGTMTTLGDLSVGATAGAANRNINIQSAVGWDRSLYFRTGSSPRWRIFATNQAESGANAGSNLYSQAFDDAGAFIDNWMIVNRVAGGTITLSRPLIHNGITAALAQNATGNATVTVGVGTQTGGAFIRAQAAAGQYVQVAWRTGTLDRWVAYRDNTAESGSNVGSEWSLAAHTDAGAFIDNVIRIQRFAGGTMNISRPINQLAVSATLANSSTTATVNVGSGTGSGATTLTVKGAAGTNRSIALATVGAWRWAFVAGTTAESGANAGSNFALAAYDDAGAFIDSPMSITRAAGGAIQTSRPVDINVSTGLRVLGTKVVGAQGATIADPTGGVTIDTEARTAINALIDRLQAHGLIA